MDAQATRTSLAFFTNGFPPRKRNRDPGSESYSPDASNLELFCLGHFWCCLSRETGRQPPAPIFQGGDDQNLPGGGEADSGTGGGTLGRNYQGNRSRSCWDEGDE